MAAAHGGVTPVQPALDWLWPQTTARLMSALLGGVTHVANALHSLPDVLVQEVLNVLLLHLQLLQCGALQQHGHVSVVSYSSDACRHRGWQHGCAGFLCLAELAVPGKLAKFAAAPKLGIGSCTRLGEACTLRHRGQHGFAWLHQLTACCDIFTSPRHPVREDSGVAAYGSRLPPNLFKPCIWALHRDPS